MSTVEHATESHHLPPAQVAGQQRKAVLLFILGDAVVFGCMLFSWFYLRALNVDGGWLPKDAKTVDSVLVWVITAVTVLSAIVYWMGEKGIKAGERARFTTMTAVGLVLVLAAFALSIYQAATWPILMSDGTYASMFIVIAGLQMLHLLILLFVGLGVWIRATKGLLDNGNYVHATVTGYFWYWVTATAVLGAVLTFFK
jgi:heme/copper-type cytochrome/quinol oxidase subunit 3